jgi:hypothetical protein
VYDYPITKANMTSDEFSGVETEMVEIDGVVCIRDDFPIWGALANELAPEEKSVIEYLYPRSGVVNDGLMYYVYTRAVASWAQLYSEVASSELLRVTGINAPVNYAKALKSTYAMCKRIAFPVARIQESICIGTYRLVYNVEYKDDSAIVHFRPHPTVIPRGNKHESSSRIDCFVVCPIVMPNPVICPYRVPVDWDDRVINSIMAPLRDDQKLDFLWRMGKSMVDPEGSVIVFYGKDGQEGKTKFITTITRMFTNAVEWVSEDLVGSESKWPNADTIMYLCEKRYLVCDECKIEDGFSYNNIKRWTSGAPISMEGRTGYLCHTLFVMTNTMPFAEKAAINNSIGRRLVIYHLDKKMWKYEALPREAITNSVILKFVSMCLTVYHSDTKVPPTSLAIALYSLFRKNINKYTADIVYDVASSKDECIAATSAMATKCGVPMSRLVTAFHAMSPSLVHVPEKGTPYVHSIRYRKMEHTQHGIEVINKRREANVPAITMDVLMERLYLMRDM